MKNSDLLDTILERTSIRSFEKGKKIPKELIKRILLAGIRAPSAGNIQPRTFIVARDRTVKERLYGLCEDQAFMKDAPLWIVVCADLHRHLRAADLTGVKYDYTGMLPYTFSVLDAALSLENMVLAVEALGLGSVIIGSVIEHPEEAREILKLPDHCLALSIICVGYPKRKTGRRQKWDYDAIVCEDGYRDVRAREVLDYWKTFVTIDLGRGSGRVSKERVKKFLKESSYGKMYSNHYKEDFVRATNRKLMEFLRKHWFLHD